MGMRNESPIRANWLTQATAKKHTKVHQAHDVSGT
jgi:hypothetical protein